MILKDKVIIVIGGCGLIGREIVKDIRKKGGICINADISTDTNLDEGEYKLNMTDFNEIEKFIFLVKKKFGHIDGIYLFRSPRPVYWGRHHRRNTSSTLRNRHRSSGGA